MVIVPSAFGVFCFADKPVSFCKKQWGLLRTRVWDRSEPLAAVKKWSICKADAVYSKTKLNFVFRVESLGRIVYNKIAYRLR